MALALWDNLPPCTEWTASKNMNIGGKLAVTCAVGAGRDGGVDGGVKMVKAHNRNCDTVQKENYPLKKERKKESARTHFSTSEFQSGEGPQRPPGPVLIFSKGST